MPLKAVPRWTQTSAWKPVPLKRGEDLRVPFSKKRQGPSVIAYVDASVLLRVTLRQPDALSEWRHIDQGISSPSTPIPKKT
ncbi:MAG: hypothetical protein ACREWE_02910 [Gammaproteobacteria bacterium]